MAFPATKMEATVQQHPGQTRHAYQLSLTYTVRISLQKKSKDLATLALHLRLKPTFSPFLQSLDLPPALSSKPASPT